MSLNQFVIKYLEPCNIANHFTDIIFNNFKNISEVDYLNHTKVEIGRLLRSQNLYGVLVYSNNKIIGYLIGEFMNLNDGRKVYYISYFYVIAKHRGNKIGLNMMKAIISGVKRKNIRNIVLTCDTGNRNLVNFYKRFGFNKDILLQNMRTHDVFSVIL